MVATSIPCQRLRKNKIYSQNCLVELSFRLQSAGPWIVPKQPIGSYYSQIIRKHFLQQLKFKFSVIVILTWQIETKPTCHLPFTRVSSASWGFVIKGFEFAWSGTNPLVKFTASINDNKRNHPCHYRSTRARSTFWVRDLPLSEIAGEDKKRYFVSDSFNVHLFTQR